MACLPFICDPKLKRGLMPIGVNILLASVLLFRLISLGCSVYALSLINTDAALKTVHTNFVDSLYVFGTIPLGYMLVVITYSCACAMMPFQVLNSVLGLAGVLLSSRKTVYVHICMSFVTIPVMVVYGVLLAGSIRDFHYGIDDTFNTRLNTGDSVATELRGKLSCCGYSGEDPCQNVLITGVELPGCWDVWSSSFRDFLSTMLVFVISMLILEVLNLVITDYEYRKWRLKEEPERAENTGIMPYIPRDAFGDIFTSIVLYWRKGKLTFLMRCLALCQGCLGVTMLVYGAYNVREYPSFVARFSVKRLRFNNVYFDDLVTALAGLLIICGGSSILISLQGLSDTCVTSRAAYYVSAFINSAGVLMSTTVVIFWGVFNKQVSDDMENELDNLFYTAQRSSHYYTYAVNLVQKLGCCGVRTEQDYINLVPITGFDDNLYSYCTNYRACAPVLQDHFRTFSAVGISLVSFMLLSQILTVLYANQKVRELPTPRPSCESDLKTPREMPTAPSSCESDLKTPREMPTAPSSCESNLKTPRVGVFGRLKQRVVYLWKEDRINGVSLITKILNLVCALSLIVTGLQLKFDYIFADIDLFSIFYLLGFNNRRFTYYLTAFAYGMLGLGIAEMTISLYGLIIYSWNSKFLEYTLIALRVTFTIVLIVILGLSIESQSNIAWTMYDQLVTEFQKYSNYHEDSEIPWKWLYFKMECCGIGNYGDFNRLSLPYGKQIPIHCCTNVTTWDPGLVYGQENCTNHLLPGSFHETGCNDVLLDRFGSYTMTLFTLISILMLFQIFDIVMSGRRIYILTPGSMIDKEIGVLFQSVTRKIRKSNVTDSNEELLVEESTTEAGPVLPAPEDMKRNTLLPSLEGEKQMAINTTKPPTDTAGDTSKRGRRRKDKKQRNKHQTHIAEVTEPVAKTNEVQDTDSSPNPLQIDHAARTISGRRAVTSLSSTRSARKRRDNARLQSPNATNDDKQETDRVSTKTDTGETIPILNDPKFDSNDNQSRSRPVTENVLQENSSSLQPTSLTRENIDIDHTDVEKTKSDDADNNMKTGKGEQKYEDNSLPYKSEVDDEENRKEGESQNKAWSDRTGTTESARQDNTDTEVNAEHIPGERNKSHSMISDGYEINATASGMQITNEGSSNNEIKEIMDSSETANDNDTDEWLGGSEEHDTVKIKTETRDRPDEQLPRTDMGQTETTELSTTSDRKPKASVNEDFNDDVYEDDFSDMDDENDNIDFFNNLAN